MKINQYVPLAIRTEKPLPKLERLVHSCLGLITEIGEVTTELKRMAIYEKPLDAERKAHILEEAGDVMWYVAIGLSALKIDLDAVANAPQLIPPDHSEGMYEATALMLGVHCGGICREVQSLHFQAELDSFSLVELLSHYSMILSGMDILAQHCGSSLGQVMADNIAKLQIRYPDKYSNEAAEGRADKLGEDARNS